MEKIPTVLIKIDIYNETLLLLYDPNSSFITYGN